MTIQVQGTTVIDNSRIFYPLSIADAQTSPTISAGSLTLDLSTAAFFAVSLNANITSITLSNVPSSTYASSFVLVFTADGTARTVAWPASFKWPSGTAPTLTSTSTKRDIFGFITMDGGTTWYAFTSGQNL
jgi:hypothetical protein